jgi:glutaredoxin 3
MMNIKVYSKPNCQYCDMSKRALEQSGLPFTVETLGEDFEREFIVENFPTARTFPIIVVNGDYLGGFAELSLMLEKV